MIFIDIFPLWRVLNSLELLKSHRKCQWPWLRFSVFLPFRFMWSSGITKCTWGQCARRGRVNRGPFIQRAAHSEEGGLCAELTANVKTVSHWAGDTFSACHYISFHMEAFADSTKQQEEGRCSFPLWNKSDIHLKEVSGHKQLSCPREEAPWVWSTLFPRASGRPCWVASGMRLSRLDIQGKVARGSPSSHWFWADRVLGFVFVFLFCFFVFSLHSISRGKR